MPTANCEWNIRAVESREIPGQFFADAMSPNRVRAVETVPGTVAMVPVRLYTRWYGSKAEALEAIDRKISEHESRI